MTAKIILLEKRCKSCGICAAFCPKQVYELVPGEKIKIAHPEACIGCKLCEYRCPDLALEVIKE